MIRELISEMSSHRIVLAGEAVLVAVVLAAVGIASGVRPAASATMSTNTAPMAPTISEPATDGQLVSGADVHMESQPLVDGNVSDQHVCSDWEIWTAAPAAVERIWFAECVGGARRLHVHLGDGVFQGSFAGRTDLPAGRTFTVRTRHRDSSGDAATEWSPYAARTLRTDVELKPLPGAPQWRALQPGYVVEEVTSGFQLPVNIAMIPAHSSAPSKPRFYVSELYGQIKVVRGDFTVGTYAKGLLNFDPRGEFPGAGELGLTGIVVEPTSGDVFAAMLYRRGANLYPKVVRMHSVDGGFTAKTVTTILDIHEPLEASHQISNLTIGPDGKLYVHMADGFAPRTARNLDFFRGKVLRVNLDGTAPTDNPFYNAKDDIKAKDYVFASGFRNPFGGAWRAADRQHYSVENGPSVDRLARVTKGADYGWYAGDSVMRKRALYNWNVAHAPVSITFVQAEGNQSAGFPADKQGHAFVSESGPTYASGPQTRGKRIVDFAFRANGTVSNPTTLVEYNGNGKSTVAGLAAGSDELYFTSLYPDNPTDDPWEPKAKIYRVRHAAKAGAAPKPANMDPTMCTDKELAVSTTLARTSVDRHASLAITLRVKNTSKRTCRRDVGPDLQELRIMHGDEKVWSSDDCGPAHGNLVATFPAGHVRSYTEVWNGRSSSGCVKKPNKARRVSAGPAPAAGTYTVIGRIGTDRSQPTTIKVR